MSPQVDLTSLSTTFPDLLLPQISRDNYVSLLHNMFGPERKVIAVQGPMGAGKTTLLAQYAKTYPGQCFSFFVGTTLITSDPRYFLLDMCDQMGRVLNKSTSELESGDTDQVRQVFHDLLRKVAQLARKTSTPYYFVVDGLELIPVSDEAHSIIDLLPAEPLPNIYLLISSEPNRKLNFAHYKWDLPFFSLTETERYLEGIELSNEEIQRIHKISQGMPGYSSAIRRLMVSGISFQELSAKLPSELYGLFDFEWHRMKLTDAASLKSLAVLAYSKEKLTLSELSQIVSDVKETLSAALSNVSFIRIETDSEYITFISEAHKQFTSDRLKSLREEAEGLLIEYYVRSPYARTSLVILPTLLAEPARYEQLKSLITPDYLTRALASSSDIAILRRTLQLAGDQAYKREDWQSLPKYTLTSSLFRTISIRPVAESEVRALLELGDFDQAFEKSYQTLLPTDRLQLLARVCSRMQQANISIPENVLSELEQMVATVDPENLRDRVIDVAAALFDLLPQSAIALLEKCTGNFGGERTLDLARAMLSLRLEAESTEIVSALITDPTLRDFARANSPKAAKLSAEEVIAEAEKIKETSGKLFLLNSWCRANKSNPSAPEVISHAIVVISNDPSYAPSILLLRQLAEPLQESPVAEASRLLKSLDIVKSTSLAEPAEELIRFDLLLATVEARQSPEHAANRLLEVYFSLDTIEELDVRCYGLVRILISLPQIDPQDSLNLRLEVERRLVQEYQHLLEQSAEHLSITRRMLGALTTYNPKLAIEFALKMNFAYRRDEALQVILRSYTRQREVTIDRAVVERILNEISERERRELALVRAIDNFSRSGALEKQSDTRQFLNKIPDIQSPRNRCYACAFALNAMSAVGETDLAERLHQQLVSALETVDAQWDRVDLGFNVISIIAERSPTYARSLLEQIQSERKSSPLAEKYFAQIYIDCLRLALRAFSGIATNDRNYSASSEQLIRLIRLIPSIGRQCQLLADLALRHLLAGKEDDFVKLVEQEVIPLYEGCPNEEIRNQTLINIGICLFEYDSDWTLDLISNLSTSRHDIVLGHLVTYLITHALPDDPVEMESLRVNVDVKTARRVCGVIENIRQDHQLNANIDELVEALIRPDPFDKRREICKTLIERDALDIVRRLEEIVAAKLPDPLGIPHKGYVITTQALINRLRAAGERRTKNASPAWLDLADEARSIPNIADRVVVLYYLGNNCYKSNMSLGHSLIQEAEKHIPSIPNVYDRASRFYGVAKVWKRVEEKESARSLLETAMSILKARTWDKSRDEISKEIIKLAQSIDPEFAASLTTLMENPLKEHQADLEITSRKLQKDPQKLQAFKHQRGNPREVQRIIGQAAWNMLGSLNSGSTQARHPREVGEWLHEMIDSNFKDVFPVTAWFIQNTLLQSRQASVLNASYQAVHDSLDLCTAISQVLLGIRSQGKPIANLALPDNVLLFQAGSRSEVLISLQEWMHTSVHDYVKIYDPYFSAGDIDILKHIAPETQVLIITSWKAQRGLTPGDRSIEQVYRDAWANISDQPPPWTQITVMGTKSGDSPLHSRFMVTAGGGLGLGTSISGLGFKDTDIRILSAEEAAKIEDEFITPQLVPLFRLYKGERLIIYPFLL
jgi:hypothetical protein